MSALSMLLEIPKLFLYGFLIEFIYYFLKNTQHPYDYSLLWAFVISKFITFLIKVYKFKKSIQLEYNN